MNSFLKFKKKTIISGKGVQIMDWERVRGVGGGAWGRFKSGPFLYRKYKCVIKESIDY